MKETLQLLVTVKARYTKREARSRLIKEVKSDLKAFAMDGLESYKITGAVLHKLSAKTHLPCQNKNFT